MKTFLLLGSLVFAALASGQDVDTASPAGSSSTTRMSNMAIAKAMSTLKMGKTVALTVDNRKVAFEPRLAGKMIYVPIRFFQELGLAVSWNSSDMRGTIRDQNGPTKQTVSYDAERRQRSYQPGKSMRPFYEKGRLWVPLASGLASFGLLAEWVPTSSRINVRSSRPAR